MPITVKGFNLIILKRLIRELWGMIDSKTAVEAHLNQLKSPKNRSHSQLNYLSSHSKIAHPKRKTIKIAFRAL